VGFRIFTENAEFVWFRATQRGGPIERDVLFGADGKALVKYYDRRAKWERWLNAPGHAEFRHLKDASTGGIHLERRFPHGMPMLYTGSVEETFSFRGDLGSCHFTSPSVSVMFRHRKGPMAEFEIRSPFDCLVGLSIIAIFMDWFVKNRRALTA